MMVIGGLNLKKPLIQPEGAQSELLLIRAVRTAFRRTFEPEKRLSACNTLRG